MLRMRKLTRTPTFVGAAIALVALLYGCRVSQSHLSEEDPFATTEGEIEELKEESRPEYNADWQIEFFTRTHIITGIQPPQIEEERLLVTKGDKDAQKAMAGFLNPANPQLAQVGECRKSLLKNIHAALLPVTSVADVTVPSDALVDIEPPKDEVDVVVQPDPKVVDAARTVLNEMDAKSIHYRLVILLAEKWVRKFPNGNMVPFKQLPPNERVAIQNCGVVDMQLRWVFLKDNTELPKTPEGQEWWDGGLNFGQISPKNPTLSVPKFLRALTSSKQVAARRFAIESDVETNPLIDNLR